MTWLSSMARWMISSWKDGQQAHAAGGGGDELELFGRVDGALAAERGAEEAQDERGGAVHEA